MKNDFLDNIIKDKLNQQEYEFTSADWASFENKQGSTGNSGSNLKWFLGGAAAIVAISIGSYFWMTENNQTDSTVDDNKEIVEQIDTHQESVSNSDLSENTVTDVTDNNITPPEASDVDPNACPPINEHNSADGSEVTDSDSDIVTDENSNGNVSDENNKEDSDASNIQPESQEEQNIVKEITVPTAMIMAGKLEICPGETVSFETIEQADVIYSWNLGDHTYSSQRVISHEYSEPGKYAVSLTVTSTKDHSVLSKSNDVIVEVLPAPNTAFKIEHLDDQIIPSIKLTSDEPLSDYSWDLGNGNQSTEENPIISFKKRGYYNVSLSSTNMEGCTAKTTQKVTIKEDYNLLAPNSFTPNGDGINDLFIPEALKLMDVDFTMSIYSKSEGLIFESKNINQQWDGRNQQNGQNCGEDTYIWVVSLTTKEGKSEHYKGAVLLLK